RAARHSCRLPGVLRPGSIRAPLVEVGGPPPRSSFQLRADLGRRVLGSCTAPGLARTLARNPGVDHNGGDHSARQSLGTAPAPAGSTRALALRLKCRLEEPPCTLCG